MKKPRAGTKEFRERAKKNLARNATAMNKEMSAKRLASILMGKNKGDVPKSFKRLGTKTLEKIVSSIPKAGQGVSFRNTPAGARNAAVQELLNRRKKKGK